MRDALLYQKSIIEYMNENFWGYQAIYWPEYEDYIEYDWMTDYRFGLFPYKRKTISRIIYKEDIAKGWRAMTANNLLYYRGIHFKTNIISFYMYKNDEKMIILFR